MSEYQRLGESHRRMHFARRKVGGYHCSGGDSSTLEGLTMLAPGPLGFLKPEDCTVGRRFLRDPELQKKFDERGYVVVPLLSPRQVHELVDGFDTNAADLGGASAPEDYNDTYAEFTIIHSRPAFRRRSFELITSILLPEVNRHIAGYQPLFANFVNKPPMTGIVPTHQNFSVVDEAEARSISVWVALVDCTTENGAMELLPGSHRHLRGRRGMWAYHAFAEIGHDDLHPLLTPEEVPAGYAVILDDALVHFSPPNTTSERRLAIQFVMVPDEATPYWFQQVGATDEGLDVAVWEVEPEFFFDFWHGDGDERFAKRVGEMTVPHPSIGLDTLLALIDGEPANPPGVELPTALEGPEDLQPTADQGPAAVGAEAPLMPARRALRAMRSRFFRSS